MFATDFEYDGYYLSDFGFTICSFNGSSGVETVSAGSKISFNTVSTHYGKHFNLAGTQYDSCITTTFSICKDTCQGDDFVITNDEYRDMMRWLNRREFLKFRLLYDEDDDREPCYYDGSFNVEKIMAAQGLVGLELTLETNKPFGYGQEKYYSWTVTGGSSVRLYDISDEVGYIYPSVVITVMEAGNLQITNDLEPCTMVIKNCSSGEVITIDGNTHIITSSLNSHKISDDFNFDYLRIGNTINNRSNNITCSLNCMLEIRFNPIIKDSPE